MKRYIRSNETSRHDFEDLSYYMNKELRGQEYIDFFTYWAAKYGFSGDWSSLSANDKRRVAEYVENKYARYRKRRSR